MTPEQTAAYVHAQSICVAADIEAMKIANIEREVEGKAFAYDEKAFRDIARQYGIYHNNIVGLFNEANNRAGL